MSSSEFSTAKAAKVTHIPMDRPKRVKPMASDKFRILRHSAQFIANPRLGIESLLCFVVSTHIGVNRRDDTFLGGRTMTY